jgi:general secretion pathway protein D
VNCGLPRSFSLPAFIVALALSGCAAQTAYKEGQDLISQGRTSEGMAKLEEANRLEPGVVQYRMAVLQARDRYQAGQNDLAEKLLREGKLDEAEQLLRQLLASGSGNYRAFATLRSVDQQRKANAWMREAQVAVDKNDMEGARARLKAVLLANPGHDSARRLAQKLDEQDTKPAADAVLAAAYRKPITIEFKEAALRSVFEVISRSSGLNFIFDKDVRTDQKTSVFLKNSTIESAVQLILLTNQLEQRVVDANTILIYPNTAAKQKDYQLLTVKSFYLANADVKIVATTLKSLLKTRDVVVDEKLNLLIVRDSPAAIKLAERLVALHDLPEPEVMLEVEILEVKRTRLLDLGIRWPEQLSFIPLPSATGGALTLADLRNLNSSGIGAAIGPVTIKAQKTDGDANLLANPRIRARNHEKAKVMIGERLPNITTTATSTGFVAESVTYLDVGLKLDVEPTIYLDGEVAIKIALEVSNIIGQVETKAGSVAYQIGTRTAQTVLRLKDGENQVLAGLINDEDRRTANKVPGLGEIPVVGRLFGSQADDSSKTEIVLSITPRIIRNVRRPDAALIEFDSGTENSLGARATAAGMTPGPAQAAPPPAAVPSLSPNRPAGGAPVVTTTPSVSGDVQTSAQPAASTSTAPAATTNTTAAAQGAVVRWQGPTQLKTGDTFALQLIMQSDQPVVSVPMAVEFDPRLLQVTSVSEGDFMRQGGAHTSFASRVDPNGQILMTGTRAGDTGATAPGSVVTINFRVAAALSPETQIQLLTIAPIGLGGRSVPVPLPAPHSVQLSTGVVGQPGGR